MQKQTTTQENIAIQKPKPVVNRLEMEKLLGELGKRPKLPRLQPPERIKTNPRGEAGVSYTLFDRYGDARIVSHAEMTELHNILAELRNATNVVNTAAQNTALQ